MGVLVLAGVDDAAVEEPDVAAVAIAAPPPAIKPVTARLAIRGFMRFMFVHLPSIAPDDHQPSPCERCRRRIKLGALTFRRWCGRVAAALAG